MKRILISLSLIGVVSSLAIGLSSAFFSDTETSAGNKFEAGTLDLLINGENNPPAIVNIQDLKPGDNQLVLKELAVQNPAWVWVHLISYSTDQGTQTEPETQEENGVPKHDIDNYIKYDLEIMREEELPWEGIINLSDNVNFPDAFSCWIPLGELHAGSTEIRQSFHFDPAVTNWAQGDTLTFSEEFYAVQSRNNPSPTPPPSDSGRLWSETLKKCVSDLSQKHNLVFTCTSGCSGTYPHTINMNPPDLNTGNFTGTGSYNPDPGYTWNVNGNSSGVNYSAHILYTGLNPGYFVDLTGITDGSGNVSGTAVSSSAQSFTFTIN